VHRGDPLLLCEDPELPVRVKVLEAELRVFEARHGVSVLRDRTEAEILKDEIGRIRAELARAKERQEELMIRSPANGTFLLPQAQDMPGRFVRRGTPLGYVVDFSRVTVRVIVPQSDVDKVRNNTLKVETRLGEAVNKTISSSLEREVPAATRDLPSLALSLEGGGSIALDPREGREVQAFQKLFQFEIVLSGVTVNRVGERVFVRFEHAPEPMASRLYRNIRRMLLERFDV